MGCSTLYHLAAHNVRDAVLLERDRLTCGTTWHSAAQVRALRSSQNLTDLIRYSIDLYQRLPAETGQATGWINSGSVSIACTPGRLLHIRRQESIARCFGVEAHPVSASEVKEKWPLADVGDVIGATWSPEDGRVNPSDLCAALVKGAGETKVFENTEVVGIHTQGGKVCGVRTSRGDIRCDAVAVCAGLWSPKTAALAGAGAPLWPCEHFYLLTRPIDGVENRLPTLSDHDSHLYLRDEGGGLLVGCFEPEARAIVDGRLDEDFAFRLLPEDWQHFEPMMENAMRRIPALADAEVKTLLNGPESFTPDGVFLLGETAETTGLFLGCGMNSVGIATGGGAGRALAHCIVHGRLPVPLPEADPKRFSPHWNSAAALSARAPEILGRHYEIAYPGRQPTTARNLRLLPLHEQWRRQNACFGQFGEWERPLYFGEPQSPELTFERPQWFSRVKDEVEQAHLRAAVFDLSPLGKIVVRGKDAESFLNTVCGGRMRCAPGRAVYALMLNSCGGIESDLVAQRRSEEEYYLYVGAAAVRRDMAWLCRHLSPGSAVSLSDETEEWAVLGLFGGDAGAIAAAVGADEMLNLPYYRHGATRIAGTSVHAARLSYVGEFGWEITCRVADVETVYESLHAAGARPAGMFAQAAMRIENKFLAHGAELDSDITPAEAGLSFAVNWDCDFVGREALSANRKPARKFVSVGFRDSNAVPLGGEAVYDDNGRIIGRTTSAAFGFRAAKPVAIALVNSDGIGERAVKIDIAGQMAEGDATESAIYDPKRCRCQAGG